MGDIVACEPVARYLKNRSPNAYIIWSVKQPYRELLDSNPYIDAVLVLHCLSERIKLEKIGLFDEVIDLHFQDRRCSLCSNPAQKFNHSGVSLKNSYNFGSLLNAISISAGLPKLDIPPQIYIPLKVVQRVDQLDIPKNFVVVHTKSNNLEKDWPLDKWLAFVDLVTKRGVAVIEVGLVPTLSTGANIISLAGKLSILETAEVIRRASLFVGIDSGPAHLANSLSKHAIILMARYLGWNIYDPFGPPFNESNICEIIRQEKINDIVTEDVVNVTLMKYKTATQQFH
jgi:ADP-heptose:LPS heptosyltransferase